MLSLAISEALRRLSGVPASVQEKGRSDSTATRPESDWLTPCIKGKLWEPDKIHWPGVFYRHDIGARGLAQEDR